MFTKHKPQAGHRNSKGAKNAVLSLVTLTFDLDLQTRPSEGPNTSSVWIWRKSVQRFPGIFHTQTKNPQTDDAWNRTSCSSLLAVGLIISVSSNRPYAKSTYTRWLMLVDPTVRPLVLMCCCYNSSNFLSTIYVGWRFSFSWTVPQRTGCFRQSTFLPITLPNVDRFKKCEV